MKQLLKRYQERLNDLSRRNRSIRISRIVKKKTFDVASLKVIDSALPMKVIESIVYNGRSTTLTKTNIEDKDQKAIVTDLNYLRRYVDLILKERGCYECYLGYPFVQGGFQDGGFFRCPLFLYPVKIENKTEEAKIVLKPLEDSQPIINKTFLLAFNKYNKGCCQIPIEKFEELDVENRKLLLTEALSLLKSLNLNVVTSDFNQNLIEPLKQLQKEQEVPVVAGSIHVFSNCVIGEFSQLSSSLNADYNTMIEEGYKNDVVQLLLGAPIDHDLDERYDEEKIPDSPEVENFFITRPDISQERVLVRSRTGKGMVIHGPPGTGKSQVITNLIADNMARGKKVLVVCEKRAALDVVNNRLGKKSLDRHALLIHDAENDRNRILLQVSSGLNEYESREDGFNPESIGEKVQNLSDTFDREIVTLREIIDLIHDKNKFNTTLHTLYLESKPNSQHQIQLSPELAKSVTYDQLHSLCENVAKWANCVYEYDAPQYVLYLRKPFLSTFDYRDFKKQVIKIEKAFVVLEKTLCESKCKEDVKQIGLHQTVNLELLKQIYVELQKYERYDAQLIKYLNPMWWLLRQRYSSLLEKSRMPDLQERWKNVRDALKEIDTYADFLKMHFQEEFLECMHNNVVQFGKYSLVFSHISSLGATLDNISVFDIAKQRFSETEKKVMRLCAQEISPSKADNQAIWHEAIKNSFSLKWINLIEGEHSELKEFSYEKYDLLHKHLTDALSRKEQLIPKLIAERQQAIYHKLKWEGYDGDGRRKNYSNLSNLLHETQKQRKRMSLRELVQKFGELRSLFPCWLASPETASAIFPLKELFDVVIFDEASQCKLERAIPASIRGKKLIVAGDEHQLPPSDFFFTTTDDDFDNEEDLSEEEERALETESLLVRARTVLPGKRLLYHYRSNHEPLTKFSNYAFYDSTLRTVPKNENCAVPSISFVNTKGIWENNCNKKEAKYVIELLKKLLKENKEGHTFGVITFNLKQADLIEDLLEESAADDPIFARLIQNERERQRDNEHVGLFVKNIENVQGDERDIIIFSVSYGYDASKKFRYRFGPLNGIYGRNRLNVAISRAKERIYVVSSFEPQDLKHGGKYDGPKLLGKYLSFCKAVSEGDETLSQSVLDSINEVKITSSDVEEYDSDFEGEVRDALVKLGYVVKTQVGCQGYKIDLGIVHPKEKNLFLAGIECDGAKYHSSKSAKDRDIYRQTILEGAGWKILRIWSRDWWRDPDAEISRLDRTLKGFL